MNAHRFVSGKNPRLSNIGIAAAWLLALTIYGPAIGCAALVPAPPLDPATSVTEFLRTPDWAEGEIDSVVAWKSPQGAVMLFATAKTGEVVVAYDGLTGAEIKRIGGSGDGPGQMRRPNGVAIAGDTLFVVERDNRRIEAFSLPGLTLRGEFGLDKLNVPYGIAILPALAPAPDGSLDFFITDDYPARDQAGLEAQGYAGRVKHYRGTKKPGGGYEYAFVNSFGTPAGPEALRVVESIAADEKSRLLYICDELGRAIKVFDTEGKFTGRSIGAGVIRNDPEGVIVWQKPDGKGSLLILSDQGPEQTRLRLFDAQTGALQGTVIGANELANTDGICLLAEPAGEHVQGILYAVNNDYRVQAYDWGGILKTLTPAPPAISSQSK